MCSTPSPSRATADSASSFLILANGAASVRVGRAFVHRRCTEAGLPETLCETAALLTSEIVTNAIVHGQGEARINVSSDPTGVVVAVADTADELPLLGRLDDYAALSGRGLAIVAHLADDWGSQVLPSGGKVVWFRLSRG